MAGINKAKRIMSTDLNQMLAAIEPLAPRGKTKGTSTTRKIEKAIVHLIDLFKTGYWAAEKQAAAKLNQELHQLEKLIYKKVGLLSGNNHIKRNSVVYIIEDYDINNAINRRLGQMSKVVETISKNHGSSKILKEVKKELEYVKEQNVLLLEYDRWLLELHSVDPEKFKQMKRPLKI